MQIKLNLLLTLYMLDYAERPPFSKSDLRAYMLFRVRLSFDRLLSCHSRAYANYAAISQRFSVVNLAIWKDNTKQQNA